MSRTLSADTALAIVSALETHQEMALTAPPPPPPGWRPRQAQLPPLSLVDRLSPITIVNRLRLIERELAGLARVEDRLELDIRLVTVRDRLAALADQIGAAA